MHLGAERALALAREPGRHTRRKRASAPTLDFTATGTVKRQPQPIAASNLAWSVARADDTDPGAIAAGTFSPYPFAGGTVTVTATDGCVTASTDVHLYLDVEVGQPTNPGDWMGTPTTNGSVPLVVYPSDETRFPRNLYRTLFQWRSQGFAEFRLTFDGPNSHVVVFTDGAHGLCAGAEARRRLLGGGRDRLGLHRRVERGRHRR